VLDALGRIDGLRMAEPGEFTRRAFENGRLDLPAVEGLADLIGAETEAQRRQAYRQLTGILGERAETWRKRLIEALALVEARIDFADEADVPEDLLSPALDIARGLRDEIADALAGSARGERLRDGLIVAIAGPPNAGKSTLLNRMARREAAIVSPFPGTTRDVVEVHLDLGGYPVTLLDTAGIRDSDDPVEQEGVRRARARVEEADLVLWVVDASSEDDPSGSRRVAIRPEHAVPAAGQIWLVRNKADKAGKNIRNEAKTNNKASEIIFILSALTGEGIESLIQGLAQQARDAFGSESGLISRERHRKALNEAKDALDRAIGEESQAQEDIVAEELRLAAAILGRLTGRVDVEDILDVIFRDFCIGK
jgi:tRNA modification GTPase